MPKQLLRDQFLTKRKSCPSKICFGSSLKIQQRFLQSEIFRQARSLSLYSTVHNEVFTEEVARQTFLSGKRLLYPRVKKTGLEFVEVLKMSDLLPGHFGVLEPQGSVLIPVEEIDVVVVPGVAFDLVGHRLGYGRGFYDRVLASSPQHTVKLGFAYDFQVVPTLPVVDHDQPLSVLMTESRTLDFAAC